LFGSIFDEEADLAVDAVHRDLVVLDNAFGVLDPERFNAAQGLGGLLDRLLTGVIKTLCRLRDDFNVADDRHCTSLYWSDGKVRIRPGLSDRSCARRSERNNKPRRRPRHMADDLAATMSASRRHCVNGAFKAVEGHRSTSEAHLQRFVINIAADLHVAAKSDLLVWV
jgi:hypothetical protein